MAQPPLVRVNSITIEGNKKTHSPIIIRELTFRKGDILDSLELAKTLKISRDNLVNTNLFLDVELLPIFENQESVDVLIRLKENWYWTVLPHFTLADRSFNEWWYDRGKDLRRITYGVDVQHRNFTGNADQFTTYLHLGFTPLVRVSYFEPYLDKKKRLGVKIDYFYGTRKQLPYRTNDDKLDFFSTDEFNFRQTGGGGLFRYRKNHNYFHYLNLGYSRNNISDTLAVSNPEYFGNGNEMMNVFNLGYEFLADFRDVRQYPLNGHLFHVSAYQYFVSPGANQTDFNMKFKLYRPLGKRFFVETGVSAKTTLSNNQNYFLLRGLGYGKELVRGYELYVLDGNSYFLNRNSLKYKLFDKRINLEPTVRIKQFSTLPITVYPVVFFDYGYVKNKYAHLTNSKLTNKNLVGGGLGLDIVTFYNTNFNVSYSINQMNEKKLFLSYGRYF